jgi:hypothetical protein
MRSVRSRRAQVREYSGILVALPRVGQVMTLIKTGGTEMLQTSRVLRVLRSDDTLVVQTRNSVYRISVVGFE